MEKHQQTLDLEAYFASYRKNIIGIDQQIATARHASIRMLYADWTASGRCYWPIEGKLLQEIMPLMANTHTDTSHSGAFISRAYHQARQTIKSHVNASVDDVLIASGSGMTDVVNKLQRILGLRVPEQFKKYVHLTEEERPVVFITHMEHHSNQTSWLETIADVVVVPPNDRGEVEASLFEEAVARYDARPLKIAAITACSNVTGISTPYHDIARVMHRHQGYCFVDFACSAPYVAIDMHPGDGSDLDAVYFSPHKFLGGPGSSGVLVFNKNLYQNEVPDNSGGGTVDWTNPWGGRKYVEDIEAREDGGTPPILQTIKAALCIELKEQMGVDRMALREEELLAILWEGLSGIPGVRILAQQHSKRMPIVSFYVEGQHFNTTVQLLNDHFGIQCRGGCSCAGTYGHYLLGIDQSQSKQITDQIDQGDTSAKPGWVRISLHPTMTDEEVRLIVEGVEAVSGISC
ncbi:MULTISPECIES: aminotransferase class V-fold PLP-dependent enzyme [unclassified Imperialibacter]|uniref:aminotransferase class V-fold PLP-dependent enzyme n=1 Tax=unclassified Imperialibacter TaxID=2629706 RepID=UPI00125926FD|nr:MULTISPECIES: aminotransferase class V-fold PLP-dependent enzyme [unclassified Imperialibacter]CAD5251145.1 Selenocysteine lyase/Cysteine desulfurase [Imperialibacter sp. 89]CAD5284084.1 Selenocysteine lyase/Cysteine desulfurase [Imperialibacter sp. 75]VVT10886.1 Selenocysteine lyase/Cysteine desulfurase [Imperialibacter sp. EC-SDR9]